MFLSQFLSAMHQAAVPCRRRRTTLRPPLLRCSLIAAPSFVPAFPGSQTQHAEEKQASSSLGLFELPSMWASVARRARSPHTKGSEARLLEKLVPCAASVVEKLVPYEVDRAKEIYKLMDEYKIKGTPDVYTIAINSCSQTGDWEFALSVYHDMKKKGVVPDEVAVYMQVVEKNVAGQFVDAYTDLDIAVIKIHSPSSPLSTVEVGSSSKLCPGQ